MIVRYEVARHIHRALVAMLAGQNFKNRNFPHRPNKNLQLLVTNEILNRHQQINKSIKVLMTKTKKGIQSLIIILSIVVLNNTALSQTNNASNSEPSTIKCAGNDKPYRDFDFIVGNWEFQTIDGNKVGEQVITKQGEGCTIIEEWTEVSGITGRGISFVDPKTGLWRQVWMSSRFHIDYSGGLNESGAMVLEGTMYPTTGNTSSPVRGVWTKQSDGSIKKEFMRFDENTNKWITFFAGLARSKKN